MNFTVELTATSRPLSNPNWS